jgi:hypothetical protein
MTAAAAGMGGSGGSMVRPDLGSFVEGQRYRHNVTGSTVSFIGLACVPGLGGEVVAVFKFADTSGCTVATAAGYFQGERFEEIVSRGLLGRRR